MYDHTKTPNGTTSLVLYAREPIKSHADIMELFHSSENSKGESYTKY